MKIDNLSDSNCCSEPVSYAAAEEDCTGGLIIEVFNDSKSCMPNPVESLLEIYEDIVEVSLVS